MATKGYMEHMKKVNKGLEYMYPNRGKSLKKWSLAKANERYRKLVEQGASREHIKFARDKVLDLEGKVKK